MIRRFIFKHMNRLLGGKTKHYGFYWDMYKCAVEGMNYAWGDYSVKNLSETNIFKLLDEKTDDSIILFDGGAHEGEYTLNFMKYFSGSKKQISIHAFEPMDKSFEIYKKAVSDIKDVDFHYVPNGLAEEAGTVPIFFNNDTSIIASLYKRQLDYFDIDFNKEETIQLTTIDEYCRTNNVERIDLLKIVVEGSEYRALQGAGKMLSEGKIKMIQFGFGGSDIDSRHYFRDFFNLLTPLQYSLYRVMKDGLIKFEKYDEGYECFHYINFLAVYEPADNRK
ncbi:MAG: FkbM family methyltransferase [Lachnospiraceae bacterium]|nr:FkbM family methyltransferase [Lachnospiraceae bacterium]